MPSVAYKQYYEQIKDVDSLLDIHSIIAGAGKGKKKSALESLHKSAIVLLTAAWEAYIENILLEAIAHLARVVPDPAILPLELRKKIANTKTQNLEESKNELYSWFFAGDGWRQIMLKFAQWQIREMDAPNSDTIRTKFTLLLGIKDVTSAWGRKGMNAKRAAEVLDEYVEYRHLIAHGKTIPITFTKSYILQYKNFLDKTIQIIEDTTNRQIGSFVIMNPLF